MEHENSKLFQLYILQAVVIVGVFTLFFYTAGFSFLYAVVSAVIGFMAIATLFRLLDLPFFILPKISGAVYVPTTEEQLKTMVKMAKLKAGQRSIDLGSGDGRIVAEFAEAGADAVGVELNPSMVEKAERLIKERKLKHAKIEWQSLWDVNLAKYDVVTIYGFPSIMKSLGKKFKAEMKPGSRVISNQYPIPKWKVDKEENKVFLYIV